MTVEALGPIDPAQLKRFDEASNHPYECRCDLCKEWWSLVPPEDEDQPGDFCECNLDVTEEEMASNKCKCCGKAVL